MPSANRHLEYGRCCERNAIHGRMRRWFGVCASALLVTLGVGLGLGQTAQAQELVISAAISLKEAAEDVGRQFQQAHPGVTVRFNFGASGALQQQIEAGAPVDAFLSAGQRQMDGLEEKGLLLPGSRRMLARNALTLIVPATSRLALRGPDDLGRAEVQRVVLGNPKTVPAGQYAEECLKHFGVWDTLRAKLVFAENVRQVLEYVAREEVEAGFVYTTDLVSRPGAVKEVARPPQASYSPILYPAAVIGASKQQPLARAFLELLMSPAGRQVLVRYGFQPPGEGR